MKTNQITGKYSLAGFAALLVVFLVGLLACSSDSDTENLPAPNISHISFIDSSQVNTAVTSTLLGTRIVIHGNNLLGTKKILMNGYSVSFNPNYILNTSIIVNIPGTVPTLATLDEVSNSIEVVTDHGSASTYFEFLQSPPYISKINNENALPGQTMVLTGGSFYKIQKIIFPGNIEVAEEDLTYTVNQLSFTVPAGVSATNVGFLTVSGVFGAGVSPGPVNARGGSYVFANFDDKYGFSGKTAVVSCDATPVPGGWGCYGWMAFDAVLANDGAYYNNNNGRSLQLFSSKWVSTTDDDPQVANYAVKFEMYITKPWKLGSIFLVATKNDSYSARITSPDPTNGFTSSGWTTVTVPLTSFKLAVDGERATGESVKQFSDFLDFSNASPLDLRFINDDADPTLPFAGAFDNVRVVKIKP